MPVLTGIDVLGIQRYVFASNRLRDSVSASWLVHQATAGGEALARSGGELLQAGGGGAVMRFPDEARARDFAARYTRDLYEQAPGLEVAVAHYHVAGALADAIEQLHLKLAIAKLERAPSVPQLGISVTAPCRITGLPANGLDDQEPTIPLSRMVLRWRNPDVRARAFCRWDAFLDGHPGCAFPLVIDDMGRTRDETSLLGIVHVDGNGVGKQITSWLRQCVAERRSDEAVCRDLRVWSSALDDLGRRALQNVVARVATSAKTDEHGKPVLVGAVPDLSFELQRSESLVFLPIRPVLLGGDDLTFLCDGRIALDLAATALDAFTGEVAHLGAVTACAGVAIVPSHTPFDRAYALAEALCSNAKRRRRESGDSGSWIDWHIGAPRSGETIGELRSRSFSHRMGRASLSLTCRPYRVGASASDRETWQWLSRSLLGTDGHGFRGDEWRQHRNKLKELAAVVREGPKVVARARNAWTVAGSLKWPGGLDQTNGFLDELRTPLLDAIELLDIHLPLSKEADA